MNNHELDRLLRQARPPVRAEAFWQAFPEQVMTKLAGPAQERKDPDSPGPFRALLTPPLVWGALAVAIVALLIGLTLT